MATKCNGEDDGRTHPRVGAIIVRPNGDDISEAFRGQHTPGNHAEQEALRDVPVDVSRGATVYTTLEPCVVRGHQASCCSRLIRAEVAEVVIGMLDPNRDIRGKGWWELEQAGIKVRYFDSTIAQCLRNLNRDFIEYQLGVGLLITVIQPEKLPEIRVTGEHRARRELLDVPGGNLTIRGSYRVKPTRGDPIVLFVRRGKRYFPQQTIDFDFDRTNSIWQAPSARIRKVGKIAENELIVARISDDLDIAIQNYSVVHEDLLRDNSINKWVGIVMNSEPRALKGLQVYG